MPATARVTSRFGRPRAEARSLHVLIAPDSFGGTLSADAAARAIAAGWQEVRPDDRLTVLPLADGGEGTLDVLEREGDERRVEEVADPLGRPLEADWLLRTDGSALIGAAAACGLHLLTDAQRDPLRATTYGVGQLLEAARRAGVDRIDVGLGGSATVDGGAGALLALGYRIVDEAGDGVKVGGRELDQVRAVAPRWVDPAWDEVAVRVWCDVRTPLSEAAATFGPQKGATPDGVASLDRNLARWADVVERDLGGRWREMPGSGAAGGLGFGLAAGLGAELTSGAAAVADEVDLDAYLADADLVVTGEGALDATSAAGKVVGEVIERARAVGVPVMAVAGQVRRALEGIAVTEEASPSGPGRDPAGDVARAARRLAEHPLPGNDGR